MSRFSWLGWCGVLALLGACGKSEGGAEPIPKAELPARIAKLVCEGMASCCQNSGHSFDLATCKSAYQAEVSEGVDELDNPNVEYDPQAAGDCLAAVGTRGACGDVDEDDAPACARIFRGKLPLGAACTDSDECSESAGQSVSCYSEDGLSPEVCTLRGTSSANRRGKLGEACNGTCFEGPDCSSDATPPTAAPGPGVPVPPSDPALCYRDDGLWCNSSSGGCEPLLSLGDACSDYDSCGGGAFCDFYAGVCSAPVADGAPCDSDDWCRSENCVYSDDPQPGTGGPSGTCLARGTVTAQQCELDLDDEVEAQPPSGP